MVCVPFLFVFVQKIYIYLTIGERFELNFFAFYMNEMPLILSICVFQQLQVYHIFVEIAIAEFDIIEGSFG